MNITITINTDNAAFLNADELENLLQKIGERITNGRYTLGDNPIIESNGNKCGNVRIEES
jgi:hypothetical protein